MTLVDKLKIAVTTSPKRLDNLLSKIIGWIKWADYYAPIYLAEEVEIDIKILKSHKNLSVSEKRRDPLLRKIMQKYEQSYCPNTLYRYFTKKDKLNYFCLRLQIDELLHEP